ncbi:MAG: hypothetical protein QOG50_2238 [Actinomycetota bacterium]|nr:hypothetical protein [Actinomycetota bacterium]
MNNLIPTESNLTHSDDNDETEPPPAAALPNPSAEDATKRLDRRGILRFGGVAALAGTAAAVMGAKAAGATTGVMHFGATNGAGTTNTSLTSSNTKSTLLVTNAGGGHGVVGDASTRDGRGYGVFGTGDGGAGVAGGTRGDGPGVRAYAEPGAAGSALQALTLEGSNSSPTISAHQIGTGDGLYSHIENASNASHALNGRTVGVGHAVLGSIVNAQSAAAAARVGTKGSGPGLEALSSKGVGASFQGKTAQIELVPSSDASHPASGTGGQLFVDSSKRLWFCRGGTNWQRLA